MNELSLTSFPQFLKTISIDNYEKIAIIDDKTTITYGELFDQVGKFAYTLKQSGIKPGDVVLLVFDDCIEWVISFLAINSIGAVATMVSLQFDVEKIYHIIKTSKAKAVVYDSTVDKLNNIFASSKLTKIVVDQVLNDGPIHNEFYQYQHNEPNLIAITSGTAGTPKLIVHSHANLAKGLNKGNQWFGISNSTIYFSTAKLSFQMGFWCTMLTLTNNGTVVLTNRLPKTLHIVNILNIYKVTWFVSVPSILMSMAKNISPNIKQALTTVELLLCGAEALPKYIETQFKQFYDKDVISLYGMSEAHCGMCCGNQTNKKIHTIGKPLPGMTLEVRRDDGSVCAVDEVGELFVKDPSSALYYLDNLEFTKETFTNGWIKTNDLVYVDSDGFYVYSGRKGDLVKINGNFISILEIENILLTHSGIADCVVLKMLDEYGLPKLSLQVILNPRITLTAVDIRQFLKLKTCAYSMLKNIEFVESFNKTITNKKIRTKIKEM